MKTDQEKRKVLSEFIFDAKRAIEDNQKRDISDARLAAIVGTIPPTLSKWKNAQSKASDQKIDTMVSLLDDYCRENNVPFDPWQLYERMDMPIRVSPKDTMLTDIIRLWRRIPPHRRKQIYDEFKNLGDGNK